MKYLRLQRRLEAGNVVTVEVRPDFFFFAAACPGWRREAKGCVCVCVLITRGRMDGTQPGLYFNQFLLDPVKGSANINHEVLVKYLPVGGVRIEDKYASPSPYRILARTSPSHLTLVFLDSVVVTETGCTNLTQVVKTIEEIEKITGY
jgi:Xaa-Pro aminopeptidase